MVVMVVMIVSIIKRGIEQREGVGRTIIYEYLVDTYPVKGKMVVWSSFKALKR